MQPVMQQTNVIHVGQGGTVIFPSSQQVNQVRPNQNAMSNQEMSFSLILCQDIFILWPYYFFYFRYQKALKATKSTIYSTCW